MKYKDLIEAHGLTLHGDIEHFAALVEAATRADEHEECAKQDAVAWMVYTQEGQSVYVTDNPTDIQEGQRALPLYTKAQHD